MNIFKNLKKHRFFVILMMFISLPVLADDKAYDIMQKNYALKHPVSIKNTSIMVILQAGGKEIKEFNLLSKKSGDQIRTRLSITKPINLDFISWSVPGKAAKQWINLGKEFTQIGSGEMSGSFLGSHFTFADLADPYLDDYSYSYLGESSINDEPCFKIEARNKNSSAVYKKTVLYIRKKDYYMV